MKLNPLVRQFFNHYLPHLKGVSPYTIRAYRDVFKLFLPFAAGHYGIKIKSLRLEHLSSRLTLSFLDDLEKERLTVRTDLPPGPVGSAFRRFDPDDLRSHIGQQHTAKRTGLKA